MSIDHGESSPAPPTSFSEYVVFVDESGDHGLRSINSQYPVFVLAFCVFQKASYVHGTTPLIQRLKFDFWGHDAVVLHSHDIRKSKGDFSRFLVPGLRAAFQNRMNEVIQEADFTLIASVIDKQELVRRYGRPDDPYEIALAFCMESLQRFLQEKGQADLQTHLLVECRGKAEDAKLELEFRRICDGATQFGPMPNLDIRFVDKKHNSPGLQLADLVAHPIGRHVLKPHQVNRAYDIVARKFRRRPDGHIHDDSLRRFP